jgi:hypothetical protein
LRKRDQSVLYFDVTGQKRKFAALLDFIAQPFDLGHMLVPYFGVLCSLSGRPPIADFMGSLRQRSFSSDRILALDGTEIEGDWPRFDFGKYHAGLIACGTQGRLNGRE